MCGVFHEGEPFVGEVEEDHCGAQYPHLAKDVDVDDVCHANEDEDEHFPADPLEPDRARELLVLHGAHDAGDVVEEGEHDERDEEPVAASEEVAEPASNPCENDLDRVPKFLHSVFLSAI